MRTNPIFLRLTFTSNWKFSTFQNYFPKLFNIYYWFLYQQLELLKYYNSRSMQISSTMFVFNNFLLLQKNFRYSFFRRSFFKKSILFSLKDNLFYFSVFNHKIMYFTFLKMIIQSKCLGWINHMQQIFLNNNLFSISNVYIFLYLLFFLVKRYQRSLRCYSFSKKSYILNYVTSNKKKSKKKYRKHFFFLKKKCLFLNVKLFGVLKFVFSFFFKYFNKRLSIYLRSFKRAISNLVFKFFFFFRKFYKFNTIFFINSFFKCLMKYPFALKKKSVHNKAELRKKKNLLKKRKNLKKKIIFVKSLKNLSSKKSVINRSKKPFSNNRKANWKRKNLWGKKGYKYNFKKFYKPHFKRKQFGAKNMLTKNFSLRAYSTFSFLSKSFGSNSKVSTLPVLRMVNFKKRRKPYPFKFKKNKRSFGYLKFIKFLFGYFKNFFFVQKFIFHIFNFNFFFKLVNYLKQQLFFPFPLFSLIIYFNKKLLKKKVFNFFKRSQKKKIKQIKKKKIKYSLKKYSVLKFRCFLGVYRKKKKKNFFFLFFFFVRCFFHKQLLTNEAKNLHSLLNFFFKNTTFYLFSRLLFFKSYNLLTFSSPFFKSSFFKSWFIGLDRGQKKVLRLVNMTSLLRDVNMGNNINFDYPRAFFRLPKSWRNSFFLELVIALTLKTSELILKTLVKFFEQTKNHNAFWLVLDHIFQKYGAFVPGIYLQISGKFRPRYGGKKIKKKKRVYSYGKAFSLQKYQTVVCSHSLTGYSYLGSFGFKLFLFLNKV